MKRTLLALILGAIPMMTSASASPIPPPPELWVMDADGTNQRRMGDSDDRFTGYDGLDWAPDSTRIVASGLSLVDVRTGEMTELTSGRDPDWSPVSDEIVFSDTISTQTSYDENLYVIESDGSDRRLLIDMPQLASSPAWSPDGEQVAFVSGPGSGEKGQVFVVDADGTDVRQLTTAGSLYIEPVWSPDGRQIVFETFEYRLHVVNADGTGQRPVADFEFSSDATWCPDGTLYFLARRTHQSVARIHSLAEDGRQEAVVEGAHPDCSSAGRLAFTRPGDVWVMDVGEPGEPNLTATEDRDDTHPEWSPDGATIGFVSHPHLPDPIRVDRTATLSLRKHLVARGKLSPTNSSCRPDVALQRITERGWRKIEVAQVDSDGRFRAKLPDRPGLYRALSPRHHSAFGEYDCRRAVSEIIEHRH